MDPSDAQLPGDNPHETLRWVLDVFEYVILPLCSPGDNLASRIRELLSAMQSDDLPVERVLPRLIPLFPESHDSVVKAIDGNLMSSDSSKAKSSIRGLSLWTTCPEICGGVAPPSELLDIFGSIIRGRVSTSATPGPRLRREDREQGLDRLRNRSFDPFSSVWSSCCKRPVTDHYTTRTPLPSLTTKSPNIEPVPQNSPRSLASRLE